MLNIDPVVQVNVSVGTSLVPTGVFDVGAILTSTPGTGTPLTATTRFAVYDSLAEIVSGGTGKPAFASTTDVYKAALKYFGVAPAPAQVVVIFYETDPEAAPYDPSAPYSVGDYCTNESKLWQCNTAIAAGGETWNAEHWTEVPYTTDTPAVAVVDAAEKGAEFYGVYYCGPAGESESDYKTQVVSIVGAMNSQNTGAVFYGATGSASDLIADSGIIAAMKNTGSRRAVGMTCTSDKYDAAGLMGVAMGYARKARNTAFALCYKSVASAAVNGFSQSEVSAIKALNGNVYVSRAKNRAGLENGATASGLRFDDALYLDMIANDIQTSIYSLIADSPTKLPQNDSTSNLFISEINRILEGYYNIGVLADAVWNGTLYGDMEEDTIIEHGYMAIVDLFDNQSAEDRAAHKAMPITILLCLSGSVESVVINLDVQA